MTIPAHAATSIPFTINMSEVVNITGTPRIPVDVGGTTRYADYTGGTGTNTLTFTYTATAGDVDLDGVTLVSPIDLNGGTIKDTNGNDATLTYTLPNTSNVKINYPSLAMDFVADSDGRYTLGNNVYDNLTLLLAAASGTFTRASIGTYFDSSGTLQTAASGTPRFDYDPVTHIAKGILIEESRTNLLTYSEQMENPYWTKNAGTISINATTAPSGATAADLITEDGTNAVHNLSTTTSLPSNTTHTISVFAKSNGRNWIRIQADDAGTNSANANFDISTCTLGAIGGGGSFSRSSSIQSIGNGWCRCFLTYTLTSAVTTRVILALRTGDGTGSSAYTGNGTSGIYIYGMQAEQGTFPTSYIPTTSATVTRAMDTLTIPIGSWFDNTKGTYFADFYDNLNIYQTYYTRIIGNGTGAESYIGSGNSFTQLQSWIGGSSFSTTFTPAVSTTTPVKGAISWDNSTTQRSIVANGGTVQTGTYTGSYTPTTSIRIGSSSGQPNPPNAPIRKVKYYSARIPDTQLQLLTQ